MVNSVQLCMLQVTFLFLLPALVLAGKQLREVGKLRSDDTRAYRSVQPMDSKSSKNVHHKSLTLNGNKTNNLPRNGSYSTGEEGAPVQPLRTAVKDNNKTQSPVEEGVNEEQPKEMPLALIIASPVVAVFIIVFVCVAYYCHSAQLDARARELAMRMKADEEMVQVMVQPPRPVIVPHDNTDMEAEHTSLRSL